MALNSQLTGDSAGGRNAGDSTAAVNADTYVINLCSSTTPMALAQPDAPELKRFRFFVSRRLEDGRERFRLHMGHFETLEEAEDWLGVVRDVYPGAWAGETPGKRLRARAAVTSQALPESAPATSTIASPAVHSAAIALQPSPAPSATPPPAVAAEPAARAAALPKPPPPAAPSALTADIVAPLPVVNKPSPPLPTAAAAAVPAARGRPAPLAPLSNVREVLAALDESDGSPRAPTPAAQRAAPAPAAAPRPVRTPDAPRAASKPAVPRAAGATQQPQSLSDTQVMQILEARRSDEPAHGDAGNVPNGIPLLRPDDTGTRRALQTAVQDNAAVAFAVQLQWSGQPLALDKVPPLAIFSAYTLYTVQGRRDGRAWHGLRLGFFSDAAAAKQVAHYVRADFAAVAVVPVSPQERGHAISADHGTDAMAFKEAVPAPPADEIKLLDAQSEPAPRFSAAPVESAKTGSAAARAAAARSKKLRSEPRSAETKGPYSLEETLEILGAGSLEIDDGRGELINESGVRHLHVEVRKHSPFQRLLARLAERVRKS
jgi:hypothetical protein